MKFTTVVAALSLSLSGLAPAFATPTNAQFGAGIASTFAQFYPGAIGAIANLSPDAADKVEASVKQACDAVKDINTEGATVPNSAGSGSIFSPVTSTIASFVASIVPNVVPIMEAVMAVSSGDASSSPKLVAIAQQTCQIVFN